MTEVWLKIFWISGTTSVVLLPLLLCARKISARYRTKSCYFLWLVLCLRLLIPVQFPMTEPVVTMELPRGAMHISDERSQTIEGIQSDTTARSFRQLSLLEGTAIIWLAGFGGILAWHGLAYGRVSQRLRRHGVILREDSDLAKELGSSVIVVRTSVDTPMTMGLLKPVIFLPKEIPLEDLPYILQHEICHLHRKDLWYKSLFLLCSAVHWFNPLVWKLNRVAGNNLELCCDETVVAGQSGDYRRCYGQILLRSAADPEIPLSTALGSGDMKGRIMNLFSKKKNGMLLVCVTVCAALLMGSLVGRDTASAVEKSPTTPVAVPVTGVSREIAEAELDLPTEVVGAEQELTADWLWPIEGEYKISALYGTRVHPVTSQTSIHSGLDISSAAGTSVLAVADGIVVQSDFDQELGNYVLVDHGDDRLTLYACLKETKVSVSAPVKQGDIIGTVGQTGQATGPHLHLEVRDNNGDFYDPMDWHPDVESGTN